jgi:predicted aconitase with swiveling domain
MRSRKLSCRKVVGGLGEGPAVVARTRLSFWGGFDARRGLITERGNPLEGAEVAGAVLVFISSKGSSEASRVMAAAKRYGKAPAAIINTEVDAMVALACVASGIPMVTDLEGDPFRLIRPGSRVSVHADEGYVLVEDA